MALGHAPFFVRAENFGLREIAPRSSSSRHMGPLLVTPLPDLPIIPMKSLLSVCSISSLRSPGFKAVAASTLVLAAAALSAGSAEAQSTATFTAAGNGTWTCPTGVTSVQVEAWGGGGGGGGVSGVYAAAGGGAGGSYVKYTLSVTPNTTYQLTVGSAGTAGPGSTGSGGTGGSSFFGNSTAGISTNAVVLAVGGPGATSNTTSGGSSSSYNDSTGATGSSSGDVPSSGATITAGGTGGTNTGGGKGSGAGGNGPTGSIAGGAGGAALTSQGGGNTGKAPGGGGSGAEIGSTTGTNVGGTGGAGEILLTYTAAVASPSITVTGTTSLLSAPVGAASGYTSFTVSGSNLTGNVTVTAPTGLQVSTTAGSGYTPLVTLTESGGTLAATTVYVEVASNASAGSFTSNLVVASAGATSVNEPISGSVVTPATAGNLEVEQLAVNAASSTYGMAEISASTGSQTTAVNTYYINSTDATALRQGNSGTTGRLASSNDGTLLTFAGFEDPTGVADETTILARGGASLSQNYTFTLGASYTGISSNQTRGATFNNGTWYMADKGGLYLNGSTSPANSTNIRPVKSFGGTVYALTQNSSSPPVLVSVSASGTTETNVPGLPADNSATEFYMLSSGVNGSTFDILYVLDGASVSKYSYIASTGSWTSNGSATLGITGDGMCASGNGTGANLYISTGATNTVYKIVDTAGYNAAPTIATANNVLLYSPSGSASAFIKGVAFAPLASAEPDLTIAVSAPGSSATSTFAYTVTLANSGAASASGVTAKFTLPSGLSYVSGTDNGSAGFTVANNSGVVSITGGTLAAGASETITVQVSVGAISSATVDAGTSASVTGDGFAVINTSATTSTPITESNSSNNGDNVAVTTLLAAPSITVSGSPTALTSSYGVASAPTSFTTTGSNLNGALTITAPSGFEISTASGSGYAGSLSLTPAGGAVSATIYVRLTAADASGNYSGNVTLASSGATTVSEAIPSSTVSPSAYLTGLSLSTGGTTQAFSATVSGYTQYVNSSSTSVTLTPTAESGASVTVNGQPAGTPVTLNPGVNEITVVVTNNGLVQTYTINVVRAAAFTPGDLVVTTYGNLQTGQAHPDGQATVITLSEFSPTIAANSTPVMALGLPSAVNGSNVGVVGEYGSSSEGAIQQTPDGLYLTIGGYSAVPSFAFTGTGTASPTTALAQSPCASVPRVGALVDVNTNANTSSVFNDIYNTNNTRCIFSPNDINMYLSGQGAGATDEGGIYYAPVGDNTTSGGAAPTPIYNVVSTRNMTEFNGNFYYSCDQYSTTKGMQTGIFEYAGAPTGTQTSEGTRITPASNAAGTVNYSPEGFWFANATTLYVADTGDPKAGEGTSALSNGGIQKWVYNGSAWTLAYTITSPGFVPSSATGTATVGETGLEALTGTVTNGVAYLYGCSYTLSDAGANGLYGATDTLTATSSTATLTEIAAAPGQQAAGATSPDFNFKGVSFAPIGSPANAQVASSVSASGATLNGSVNPNGQDTVAYFQYGTSSSSLTSQTTEDDLGSGDSSVPISAALTGLQPGTTYYYELVTVSNGLTSTYAVQSFTTAGTAPQPTDTPTMPPAGLVILALALVGYGYQTTRRRVA